jgi:putative DNA methylase
MPHPIKSPRKLIEVALPLDAINEACAYEKMPGIGAHPRGIHLWWARRPLAAARAVLFAQLVNDPGTNIGRGFKYGRNKKEAAEERKRLFKIIEDLVLWENTTNEEVLERARAEIWRSWREVCELNKDHPQGTDLFNPNKLPAFHDPFAGGGAIPLEAQRLGLESYATDLNPVAVLINKAMIEIPPKFAGLPPVSLAHKGKGGEGDLGLSHIWPGASGIAEDLRHYGAWMRDEAVKRIGHLYPPVEVTSILAQERPDLRSLVGQKLPVIAWLWARTVKSPNPAFSHADVPLVSTFILANNEGKEAYVQPIVEGGNYKFTVKVGTPPSEAKTGTKLARGAKFRCLLSNSAIEPDYIKAEGTARRMGTKLMAVVAEGTRGRVYLPPTDEMEAVARTAQPSWKPEGAMVDDARAFTPYLYGLSKWSELFTPRQLVALSRFKDLVSEAHERIRQDALIVGLHDDFIGLEDNGSGATAYADALSLYLAFVVDRSSDFSNTVTRWVPGNQKVMNLFGKQAIHMTWDFPEASILADTVGGFCRSAEYIADCLEKLSPHAHGFAIQADAQCQTVSRNKIISTDPPYYDNIPYADLSDFFYAWLRPTLRSIFPKLLSTMAVPKAEELVATTYRHGGADEAEKFFLAGMVQVIHNLAICAHPEGPVTIYYAFKQSETSGEANTSSTGWETFLSAVLQAGFSIVGTWPLRSEQEFRMRSIDSNALASSIVLVCRKRPAETKAISRREFLRELNTVLPEALDEMTKGSGDDRSPVAPVDLSQAIIGPGMAVFSKYSSVLEADGSPMSVRTALQLINRFLAEDDFDADTQFCLNWFQQHGWGDGAFGEADTLSRGKGTSVDGIKEAGVLHSGGGKVRLLKWSEYPIDWDPRTDKRTPIWEALHQLIRALRQGGDSASGALLAALGGKAESVRQLAYRLYTLCERLGQAEDARAYNELITSWSAIESAAAAVTVPAPVQHNLFGETL